MFAANYMQLEHSVTERTETLAIEVRNRNTRSGDVGAMLSSLKKLVKMVSGKVSRGIS